MTLGNLKIVGAIVAVETIAEGTGFVTWQYCENAMDWEIGERKRGSPPCAEMMA